MLALTICVSLLAITTELTSLQFYYKYIDVVQSKYVYRPKIYGWIAQHRIVATWEEAYRQCRSEDYALLASPITAELQDEMTSLITGDTAYFIGTRAMYHTAPYVSIEGVVLEDMPAVNMIKSLDPREGQCLCIDRNSIRAVPCTMRLPYMCYKKEETEAQSSNCGTSDSEYELNYATGTCLKIHKDKKSWPQAFSTCISEGGHLAVFRDETGLQSAKNITFPNSNELFIGLQDREGNGDWLNIYGERVEQLNSSWKNGKKPVHTLLRCGAVLSSAKLDNVACDAEKYFLCERELNSSRFPPSDEQQ